MRTLALATLLSANVAIGAEVTLIPYDHFESNGNRTYRVEVDPGTFFEVQVSHTCDKFQVGYEGVLAGPQPQPAGGAGIAAPTKDYFKDSGICIVKDEPTVELVPHTSKFAAYVVRVTRKDDTVAATRAIKLAAGMTPDNAPQTFNSLFDSNADLAMYKAHPETAPLDKLNKVMSAVGEIKDLKNVELFVSVDRPDWLVAFAGGLSISEVTDPQFAVRGTGDDRVVIRDREAEDGEVWGLLTMLHLSPRIQSKKHPERGDWGKHFAVSFGLGLTNEADTSVYFGPSWRMGSAGYITLGVNWKKVKRLPNGQEVDAPPISENVLSNLQTKTDRGGFISWTYPFLGKGKEDFDKSLTQVIGPAPTEKPKP